MEENIWSLVHLQDLKLKTRPWKKKETIYATDADKCLRGVYYALLGEEPTSSPSPDGLRRMEIGNMVEDNVVKKMKSQGIFLTTQNRIFDEEYKVSGRLDALIINPDNCTVKAKKAIERKQEIFELIREYNNNFYAGLGKYRECEITKAKFRKGQQDLNEKIGDLYDEDYELNQYLLEPNPKNQLGLIEVKSISEFGFTTLKNMGKPNDGHYKQIMYYYWKLREKYPNLTAKLLYIAVPYQQMMEFDIEFDESVIDNLKKKWEYIWECVDTQTPPVLPATLSRSVAGKAKLNYQADYCDYHIMCTEDPNWKAKALEEVVKINEAGKIKKSKIDLGY